MYKNEQLALLQPGKDLFEVFFVVGAEGSCTAVDDVAAADADGGKTGKQYGDHPCPAVFDTDNTVAVFERDTESDAGGFGIEPRVRLG